jgi:hypothetical protein
MDLYRRVLDTVQLIPDRSREQILVQLPRGARAAVIALVRLALATLDAQRERTLVISNG